MSQNPALFQILGGEPAIDLVVKNFYAKMLQHPELKTFFKDTSLIQQIEKQKAFLTHVFGGSPEYNGRSLRAAHKKAVAQGLNDTHFDLTAKLLQETLEEAKIDPKLITMVMEIVASTRNDVLCKPE